MLKNIKCNFRLLLLLFTLNVSVPLPMCETVNIHGLFGEIQSSVIIGDFREDVSEIASRIIERIRVRGINIFNECFFIAVVITCLTFAMCIFKLPGEDTIVAKKVRMDN